MSPQLYHIFLNTGIVFAYVKCAGFKTVLSFEPSFVFIPEKGWVRPRSPICPPNSSLRGKDVSTSVIGLPPYIVYTPYGVKGAEV